MACTISQGLAKSCNYFLGGLSQMWLANATEVSAITSSSITMSGSCKFYEYEFERNTGSFVSELAVSNGQKSVTHKVSFSLAKKDATVQTVADQLALGRFVAICKDRNSKYFVLGRNNGLQAEITSLNSGAAEGDFGGLSVTLGGAEIEMAFNFTGTIPV